MFPSLKLFKQISCPNYNACNFKNSVCFFSHSTKRKEVEFVKKTKINNNNTLEKTVKKVKVSNEVKVSNSKNKNPLIKPNVNQKVSTSQRQKTLNKFFDEFNRIYGNLVLKDSLAHADSIRQEEFVHEKCTKSTYVGLAVGILKKLKLRPLALDDSDVGIDGEWTEKVVEKFDEVKLYQKVKHLVLTAEQLKNCNYPTESSILPPIVVNNLGGPKICDRCSKEFRLSAEINYLECLYHHGRIIGRSANDKIWSCCNKSKEEDGCTRGPHVFKDDENYKLNSLILFKKLKERDLMKKKKNLLIALDCEMSYTTQGMELTRVTIVNFEKKILFDEIIKPESEILDSNQRYSGLTRKNIECARLKLADVQNKLDELADEETIIVGHGLENDFKVLRLMHNNVIDTSVLFLHPKAPVYKYSLKFLAQKYLQRSIQKTNANNLGHDSFEDAEACVDLLLYSADKN
ncbi:hypothetical protein HK099_007795 [Clydaea vesicula]|uniref:Exonuclease domain-containing protein n=1 Tax=Clydaea vesicula TaxID=447962 RepID=A0AAD5TYK2_9FUNG|nr:hypothetical protein HK099_007795 [Clydaea vesicula]KAJ3378687.1 hypothetical protein HDU92_007238 [Lobulomyces angularis]